MGQDSGHRAGARRSLRVALSAACALLILLPLDLAAAQPVCRKVVISADPKYPPLHWYDGSTLTGASVDIATRVFTRLGVRWELQYLGPWPRVLSAAEHGGVDVVTTLKDTPERRAFLDFTKPVLSNPIAVFVTVDYPINFLGRESLIGRKGGLTRGNRFGDDADRFVRERLDVEELNDPETGFRMLMADRIDYFLTGLHAGRATLIHTGLEGRIIALAPYLAETSNAIGFVRNSPCRALLPAANRVLDEMISRGEIKQILDRNLERWRRQPVLPAD